MKKLKGYRNTAKHGRAMAGTPGSLIPESCFLILTGDPIGCIEPPKTLTVEMLSYCCVVASSFMTMYAFLYKASFHVLCLLSVELLIFLLLT